jgi:hypothetical protein
VSSDDQNKTDAPTVQADAEAKKVTVQFTTSRSGSCVGRPTVELGQSRLYTLPMKVYVSRDSALVVYHPANPQSAPITFAHCTFTYFIVANRSLDRLSTHLRSTCRSDKLDPADLTTDNGASLVVKLTFGDATNRLVTTSSGTTRLEVIKSDRKQNCSSLYCAIWFPTS